MSAHMLWDATVVSQSKRTVSNSSNYSVIDAYKVQYTKWSGRYIEWVKPSRVIEPSDHNRLLQVSSVLLIYYICRREN
jgi:hypothetical protein